MKYSETKYSTTYELEIVSDGVRYTKKSKDTNTTDFIRFENIGNDVSRFSSNRFQVGESSYYKYFLVVSFAYGIYSYITTGAIGSNAILFLFIAVVFWLFSVFGKEKVAILEGISYGNSIVWHDTKEVGKMFDQIKEKRNFYLKEKYLNSDGSLKEIIQNEQTIRNMSLYGIVENDLVLNVEKHNEIIFKKARSEEPYYD